MLSPDEEREAWIDAAVQAAPAHTSAQVQLLRSTVVRHADTAGVDLSRARP